MITDTDVIEREKMRTDLLRANTKIHRYMYELDYARKYIDGLMDFLINCKISKKKQDMIYAEILEWHKRIKRYEKYIENVV